MTRDDNVVQMADYLKQAEVKPKSEARRYKGHAFTLLFNPNAVEKKRWGYIVKFTRVYEHSGSADTLDKAATAAKKYIDTMEGRQRVAS